MIVHSSVASSATSPGVAARTLACIADVLGAMAGERAGLRSGPARNESWMQAFELLDVCTPLCCLGLLTRIPNTPSSFPSRLIKIRRILTCTRVLSVCLTFVGQYFAEMLKKELTLDELLF